VSPPPAQVVCLLWLLSVSPAAAQPGTAAADPPSLQLAQASLEVPVAPGRPITFLFDAALDPAAVRSTLLGLGLQHVAMGEDTLTFQVPAELQQGTRLPLALRYADGLLPERVSLVLVVDAAHAQASVAVPRRSRGAQSCEQALAAKDAELATLRQQLRDRAGSLTELIATGVLTDVGLRIVPVSAKQWKTSHDLVVTSARLYVAPGRMAVEVTLTMGRAAARPWIPTPITVTENGTPVTVRAMRLLKGPLLRKKDTALLVVEWEAPAAHPERPLPSYTLGVEGQDGSGHLQASCLGSAQCEAKELPWGK
jgi:uncharacterized protein (TIGR02268 family)